MILSCDGMKFATLYFAFAGVEVGCHQVYTCRIAYQNDIIGQPFGAYMEMKDRAIFIDD